MSGEVSEPGRFGPLGSDHPSVGDVCLACKQRLKVGDVPALVSIGPGDVAGRVYNGVAVVAHEECVHGQRSVKDGEMETEP